MTGPAFLPGTLFLIDTSAAARINTAADVRRTLERVIDEGMAATCVFTDLEALYSVRDPKLVTAVADERQEFFTALALTDQIAQRARDVQCLLARRGLHRAAGPIDLLVAATAEHYRAIVLHYDADFEHIASVTGQHHQWVAPRGSID